MRIEGNAVLRLSAKGSPHRDLEWDFSCECGGADCTGEVPLTILLYEELRATGEFILAEGHSLHRPDRARAWLRSLREVT